MRSISDESECLSGPPRHDHGVMDSHARVKKKTAHSRKASYDGVPASRVPQILRMRVLNLRKYCHSTSSGQRAMTPIAPASEHFGKSDNVDKRVFIKVLTFPSPSCIRFKVDIERGKYRSIARPKQLRLPC